MELGSSPSPSEVGMDELHGARKGNFPSELDARNNNMEVRLENNRFKESHDCESSQDMLSNVDERNEALDEYWNIIQMIFESEEDCYRFYNSYARKKGFSIRKETVRREKKVGDIYYRRFVCSKEGIRDLEVSNIKDRKRRERDNTRENCRAELSIMLDMDRGVWFVDNFVDEHNHNLTSPDRLLYSTWRTEFLTRERDVSDNPSPQKIEAINRSVKEYFDYDMVLFPMNVEDSHWIVAAMDTKRQEIQILDSLWNLQIYKEKIERLLNGIEADVSVSRKHLDPLLPDVTSWPIRQIQNIPKQTDGHSCGLFALKYMEHWDGTRLKIDFTQRDVCISRKKMIAELIFSHANQNEEVKKEVRKIMRQRETPT